MKIIITIDEWQRVLNDGKFRGEGCQEYHKNCILDMLEASELVLETCSIEGFTLDFELKPVTEIKSEVQEV